jgi:D-tyrosyl-tRNA(Tyr) deacylase
MLEKLIHLRAFSDSSGKMNLSLLDIQGSLLIVSQFTLYADLSSGRRPSFTKAAPPDIARNLYEKFVALARARGIPTETGEFGQHMEVSLINSGPVTFLLDSKEILP